MTAHAGNPRGQSRAGEADFRRAVAEVDAGLAIQRRLRPYLRAEAEPPPRRLAPFAYAVAATVYTAPSPAAAGLAGSDRPASSPGLTDDDAEIGSGKFVLLFDAAGQPGWDGGHRIIGYVRADLEPEMAADPLINEVGWSWLTEALDDRTTGYRSISGTVTTVVTQGFGNKQDEPMSTGFELRASWSPALSGGSPAGLDGHVAAWCDVICVAAGLPPLAPGVVALRLPRRRPRQ